MRIAAGVLAGGGGQIGQFDPAVVVQWADEWRGLAFRLARLDEGDIVAVVARERRVVELVLVASVVSPTVSATLVVVVLGML